MADIISLKKLALKKFQAYSLTLKRGYPHDRKKYRKIKEAMMDITVIENYEFDDFLKQTLIDFHTVNLNRL